jgi:lipoprotein NlpI
LLTPVGPRKRTFAQWSLENTVDSGLRANQKQVQALRENLASTFQAGISRLEESQTQSARLLQRELQYQADNIIEAIDRGSADVVGAVQKACDYLGGQLCEVRWAIERQSQISQQILQILLNALDNTSRQYWEQGVKCYETSEYDIARERFSRALDANRTNYFAYQYLGFIAVQEEKGTEALKNFELARKFADTGYHRALALSHLARSHHATGDLPLALQSAVAATAAAPDHAKFWYECAVFHVRGSNAEEAIQCLRRAISGDWTYWSISVSDANLDFIRQRVERLLEEMREGQRVIAKKALDDFVSTMKMLQGMQITAEVSEWQRKLGDCEASYREGTVFAYRNLLQPAHDAQKQALQSAIKVLDQRVASNRSLLSSAQAHQREEVGKVLLRISEVEAKASEAERNAPALSGGGCLCTGVAVFFFLFSVLLYYVGQKDTAGTGFFVAFCFGIYPIGVLLGKIGSKSSAASIRSQSAALTRERAQVEASSKARLSEQSAQLEGELSRLQRHQQDCQKKLAELGS